MSERADMVRASSRFWTVSNMLSLSRVVLAIPFLLVTLMDVPGGRWWAVAIIVVGALTDNLDGLIARRRNEISEWGKILDPLGDKVGLGAVAVVLLVKNVLPLWFFLVYIGRDLLILAGGMYIRATRGVVLPSNKAGKWTVGVVAGTLLLRLLDVRGWPMDGAMTASVVMIVISFAGYVARFVEVVRPRESVHGNS